MNPPGVRWIVAANPSPMTLDGTRTYIVGRRSPVVVDPGPADAEHVRAIREALADAVPVAIVVTHHHSDHYGAAAELSRETGAPVWRSDAHEDLRAGERPARQGDEIHSDEGVLRVVETAGHSPDHIALHWMESDVHPRGAVFVGDLLMGQGDTTLVAPPEGNLARYLESLRVVRELKAETLYPAHGPPIASPDEAIERYRRHRQVRIEQVRAEIEREPGARPEDLVDAVYGADLDPRLRRAAAGSIGAILEYLQQGGGSG